MNFDFHYVPGVMNKYFKGLQSAQLNRWIRLLVAVSATGFILLELLLANAWPNLFGRLGWVLLELVSVGLIAYLIASWAIRSIRQTEELTEDNIVLAQRLQRLQKQQQVVFEFGRNLVETADEEKMIEQVLNLALEVSEARGASFVPFDEREQPKAAISRGVLPVALMEAWSEHLASETIRSRCAACDRLEAEHGEGCPVFQAVASVEFPGIEHVQCMTLRCGTRRVGMLTLYLGDNESLDRELEEFLRAIVDETALGLESIRLRKREVYAIQQLQLVRQKTDLEGIVTGLLEHIQATLEADFSVLHLHDPRTGGIRLRLIRGTIPPQLQSLVESVVQGVSNSTEPIMMSDVSGAAQNRVAARSIMATPLFIQNGPSLGAILVGYSVQSAFSHRQLDLLNTLAGHMALVVNNAMLISELEYKTMLDERTRLAREIHDGLAQTLGFLKLQVAQLQYYLDRSEYERLDRGLHTSYNILSEAYLDVRDAIDGLRTNPVNDNIETWLGDLLVDFEEATGIKTSVDGIALLNSLTPEIQVQLIRIIQEALSNVRKHAYASQLNLHCFEAIDKLVIEIHDNGRGFTPAEVSTAAQYGLRGMRERADLIGADFQVTSCPQDGTTIHIGMNMPAKEKNQDEQ